MKNSLAKWQGKATKALEVVFSEERIVVYYSLIMGAVLVLFFV